MLIGSVVAWALAGSAPPPPAPAAASTLSWSAPSQCPDQAAVTTRIEALLGGALAAPRSVAVQATGEIVADRASFVLRLQVRSESGARRREIAGGDCVELGMVAALLVAIAIDPGVAQLHEPGPEPEPEPEVPTPEPDPQSEPEAIAVTPPAREWGGSIGIGAGVSQGPLPSLGALVQIAAALRWRFLRAELGIGHRVTRPIASSAGNGARADISATAVMAGLCGVPKAPHVEFPLCVGAEVGALSGRSRNVAMPAAGAGLWAAARGGGGLIVLPTPRLGIAANANVVVPLSRPGFVVDGVGELHRAARVGVDAVIALEIRFP